MYYVECQTKSGDIRLLHDPHSETVKLYSGVVTLVLNAVSDFRFSILPNHPLFAEGSILPYVTKVRVTDETGKFIFRGRVLDPTYKMVSDGLLTKEYIAEDELAYLVDSKQRHAEYHNVATSYYLELLLDAHNASVGKDTYADKTIRLGNVTVADPETGLYRYVAYDTTLKNIQDDLISSLGGYISIRHEGDTKYLDYLADSGTTSEMSIELAVNLRSIESQNKPSEIITRLIPLGAEYEDVELAIDRLTAEEIIRDPDYWRSVYGNFDWLGQLLINLSRLPYDLGKSNVVGNSDAAILFLAEAGAINSPEYWITNHRSMDNLWLLLIRAANYTVTSDTSRTADAALPRLTIKSVNNGVDYIDDGTGFKEQYGIVEGFVIWDDVTVPSNLKQKGEAWLGSQRLRNSVTISAVDLSLVDESYESFVVGNYYRAKNDLLGIDITHHLIEQEINIVDPSESTLTFGDNPIALSRAVGSLG